MKRRIKWVNVIILEIFILTSLMMLKDAFKLLFSTIQYTNFGITLELIIFITWFVTGSFLESEI